MIKLKDDVIAIILVDYPVIEWTLCNILKIVFIWCAVIESSCKALNVLLLLLTGKWTFLCPRNFRWGAEYETDAITYLPESSGAPYGYISLGRSPTGNSKYARSTAACTVTSVNDLGMSNVTAGIKWGSSMIMVRAINEDSVIERAFAPRVEKTGKTGFNSAQENHRRQSNLNPFTCESERRFSHTGVCGAQRSTEDGRKYSYSKKGQCVRMPGS
jgi:hypothetical protein